MPRIRREGLPRALLAHLLERAKSRHITVDQLGLLADWLATEPEVPHGKWFKRFPSMWLEERIRESLAERSKPVTPAQFEKNMKAIADGR